MYGVIVFNKESVVMADREENAKFLIWNEGDFVVVSGFSSESDAKEWIQEEEFIHTFVIRLYSEERMPIPRFIFDRAIRSESHLILG